MGKKGKDIQKGKDAERLVNDPLYKVAFEDTKKALIAMLLNTAISEEVERDRIYITIKALGLVDEHIQSVINTGKLAEGPAGFYKDTNNY
jgi:hypothetical protein